MSPPSIHRALLDQFPGSTLRTGGGVATLSLATDDVVVPIEIREAPAIWQLDPQRQPTPMLYARTIALDGFWLRLRSHGRWLAPVPGPIEQAAKQLAPQLARLQFQDYAIVSNDAALAKRWIDAPIRQAVTRTLGVQLNRTSVNIEATVTGCVIDVEHDAVTVIPATLVSDHLAATARVVALLATRPTRIARELTPIYEQLGAVSIASRFELAHDDATVIERPGATVRIDHVRHLPGEDAGVAQLRTRVRARREAPDHVVAQRLCSLHRLISAAAPWSLAADGDEIELLWIGLIDDPERLERAVELVAGLAAGTASSGPYR